MYWGRGLFDIGASSPLLVWGEPALLWAVLLFNCHGLLGHVCSSCSSFLCAGLLQYAPVFDSVRIWEA